MTPTELRALVDTIVVVMLENRSFDHVFGFLSHESFGARTDVEGLHRPGSGPDWSNYDEAGNLYPPTATRDGYLPSDLPHGRRRIAAQIRGGAMDGFISAYFGWQPDRSPAPMRFCTPADVPVSAALAEGYAVCDHWFASLPADTQPNRLMAMSGYSRIDTTGAVKLPHLLPEQTTIFDWLERKGKRFELYVDSDRIPVVGVPSNLLLMSSQRKHVYRHGHPIARLAAEWQSSRPAPDVIYCEPFYNDFATVLGQHGTCNHAPLPLCFGEGLLKRLYRTLTSNPNKWARTVLVICYDEHGGFFDHVSPPAMHYAPPPHAQWENRTPFDTLGVRIPGLVVSPLVERGSVFSGLLDHTSILQLMVDRHGEPADLDSFGDARARRLAGVHSLADVLTRSSPRADILAAIPDPPAPTGTPTLGPLTETGEMFQAVIASSAGP